MELVRFAVLSALVATSAAASVVWRGGFETGDISEWSGSQKVSSDRLQVIESPVRDGRYALRATVRQGDDPIDSSGNRNELLYASDEPSGSEYFYRWNTLFPTGFPSANTWQVFVQWHHRGCCGSPPVEFYVVGEQIRFRVGGADGTVLWTTPLQRGVWNDFVLHVKWSADPKVGFVELFHNGEPAVAKRQIATMYAGMTNYLKLGLYRNETIAQDGIVFHDGMVQATRLEDVAPAPGTSPTPSPTPTPAEGPSSPPLQQPISSESPPTSTDVQTRVSTPEFGCTHAGGLAASVSLLVLALVLVERSRQA